MSGDWGAGCFGAVLGWITYFTIRYKKQHAISDLSGVVASLGGAAVLSLFSKESGMFAAYSIGLACGFFGYVLVLLLIGLFSKQMTLGDLLDGTKTKNPFMSQ